MATEAELRDALERLEAILRENDLGFVIDQERSLAVEGVLTQVDERAGRRTGYGDEDVFGEPPNSYSVNTSDVTRRPLAVDERVAALLDLIEAAIAATVEIEQSVRTVLSSAMQADDDRLAIRFSQPEEAQLRGDTMENWELPSASALAVKLQASQAMVATLDRLRAALDVRRGSWLDPVEPTSDSTGKAST